MKGEKTGGQQDKFQALFENAPIGIIVVNEEGKIALANSFALNLFDYSANDLIGHSVEQLIPEPFAGRHSNLRGKFMEHPQTRPMGIGLELRGKRKSGDSFPVEISLSHYRTAEGLFVIAFIIDITIRKQHVDAIENHRDALKKYADEIRDLNTGLEVKVEDRTMVLRETLKQLEQSKEELAQLLEKEKELSDLKSRFVAMASHEFRTPLSTILSSASLINKYPREEDQERRNRHVSRIKENVKNLTDILEDFLSLEKLEEGLINVKYEAVEISSFINSIIYDLSEVKKPGQTLEYKHRGALICMVDRHLLKNIVINLVSNAIKFSAESGMIKIKSSLKKHTYTFSVKDFGIGISKQDQQHLFDRFFRAKNAINIKGTGLGLHIVSKYLSLLNGSIKCVSALNKGTEFTITFNHKKSNENNSSH